MSGAEEIEAVYEADQSPIGNLAFLAVGDYFAIPGTGDSRR